MSQPVCITGVDALEIGGVDVGADGTAVLDKKDGGIIDFTLANGSVHFVVLSGR